MQRRVLATMAVHWPDMPFSQDRVLNIMVGDLQRIWVYAARGWSAPQPIPGAVRRAFDRLVEAGYREHLPAGV